MKFSIGVTGGIGSGKSTVCRIFGIFGIPVFISDDVARNIMETNAELKSRLNAILKQDIYISGSLDRPGLASLIFNNSELLSQVNALVHPYVFDEFERWTAKQDADYVIMETAILFESHAETRIDKVVAVIAPMEERISRVISRNKMSRNQVIERIRNQISEEEMIERSDFIISNSENEMIISQVIDVHNRIKELIRKS